MVKISILINLFNFLILNYICCKDKTLPLATIMDANFDENYTFSNCFLFNPVDWISYDLTNLAGVEKSYDHNITVNNGAFTIFYDFCADVKFKCKDQDTLIASNYSDGTCKVFTQPSNKLKKWRYINNSSEPMSISLQMETNEKCTDKFNFTTIFNIKCDEKMPENQYSLDLATSNNFHDFMSFSEDRNGISKNNYNLNCERKLSFISRNACPRYDRYSVWKFYIDNNSIFGMTFILSGCHTLFFGYKHETLTTYIYGVFCVMFITYCGLILLVLDISFIYIFWFVHLLELIIGLLIANYLNQSKKLKIAFFGGMMGMAISNLLYFIIFARILIYPYFFYFGSVCFFVISSSLLCLSFLDKNSAIIISSSVSGSYLIIRVSFFFIFRGSQLMPEECLMKGLS